MSSSSPNLSPFVATGLFLLVSLLPVATAYFQPYAASVRLRRPLNNGELYSSLKLNANSVHLTSEEEAIGEAARRAAWAAGKLMLEGSGRIDLAADIESKVGSRDIVTEVDKKCQEVIMQTILLHFPHHKFLGEEDVAPGREASEAAINELKNEAHLWIVDPVDGTTNFAHGMPLAAVIIAYAEYGVVKHGFIFDPFRNESFTAWRGKGAYMNGQRIRVDKTERMDSAVVCTGSPPNLNALAASLRATQLLSPKVRSMRVLGSAAVHLAWASVGRITAYFEADLNAWDLMAGALIVEEAGGRVTDVWGQSVSLTTRNTVASNGKIHAELLRYLIEAKMHTTD